MKDFEIGGHSDMSLEEVQEYQQDGWDEVEEMRDNFSLDEETHDSLIEDQDRFEQEIMGDREPNAELSHHEFIDEQTKFEEEIMGEREPGAELSHQEFIDAQDKFEEEIMNGGVDENSTEKGEDFDPEWVNPSYEDIVAQPDAEEGDVSWATEGFSEAAHAIRDDIGSAAETIDLVGDSNPLPDELTGSIQVADAVGDAAMYEMDTHIEDIDNFGMGTAEAMLDMEGGGITASDLFIAESDYLSSQSTDIDENSSGSTDSSDE